MGGNVKPFQPVGHNKRKQEQKLPECLSMRRARSLRFQIRNGASENAWIAGGPMDTGDNLIACPAMKSPFPPDTRNWKTGDRNCFLKAQMTGPYSVLQ